MPSQVSVFRHLSFVQAAKITLDKLSLFYPAINFYSICHRLLVNKKRFPGFWTAKVLIALHRNAHIFQSGPLTRPKYRTGSVNVKEGITLSVVFSDKAAKLCGACLCVVWAWMNHGNHCEKLSALNKTLPKIDWKTQQLTPDDNLWTRRFSGSGYNSPRIYTAMITYPCVFSSLVHSEFRDLNKKWN